MSGVSPDAAAPADASDAAVPPEDGPGGSDRPALSEDGAATDVGTPQAPTLDWLFTIAEAPPILEPNLVADDRDFILYGAFQADIQIGTTKVVHGGNLNADQTYYARVGDGGSVAWTRSFTATCGALAQLSVTADGIYAGGGFACPFVIGSQTYDSSDHDAFIAALDRNGLPRWSTAYGGPGGENVRSLGVDSAGNVYVAGDHDRGFTLGSYGVSGDGTSTKSYLASFTAEGKVRWLRDLGVVYWPRLVVRGVDDLVVAGSFAGTLNYDRQWTGTNDPSQWFIAGFGAEGKAVWSQAFPSRPGEKPAWVGQLLAYGSDRLYVSGRLLGLDGMDPFGLIALGPRGEVQWTARDKSLASTELEPNPPLALGPDGDLYLASLLAIKTRFAGHDVDPAPDPRHLYLARIHPDATPVWLMDAGAVDIGASSLAVTGDGRIGLVGYAFDVKTVLGRPLKPDGAPWMGRVVMSFRP
jgi:hypothetical protein